MIEKAYEAGDKETVIDAYLDILDYNTELAGVDASFFEKVLESMSYEEAIDHVLFGQIKEQMDSRGFSSRLYRCVYYLHANGGLTAADLLKEMAADSSLTQVANSELFKAEFVEKVLAPENPDENPLGLDASVFEQVQLAFKQLKGKIDTDFYDSAKDFLGASLKAEDPPAEEPVDAPEQASEEAQAEQEQ